MIKILIGIFGLVLVTAGATFYVAHNTQMEQKKTSQEMGTEQRSITEGAFAPDFIKDLNGSGSFKDLLSLGKDVMCTISYAPTKFEGTFNGTAYVSGDNIRIDMTTSGESMGDMQISVINDATMNYVWGSTSAGAMAYKFAVNTDESDKTASDSGQFNLDEYTDYDCTSWTADGSKFIPPTDITFTDQNTLIMQMAPDGVMDLSDEGVKAMQCSACDQITEGDAKAQCLQTFACN